MMGVAGGEELPHFLGGGVPADVGGGGGRPRLSPSLVFFRVWGGGAAVSPFPPPPPYTRVVEWGWGRALLWPGGGKGAPNGSSAGSAPGATVMVLGGNNATSSGALLKAKV